MTLELPALRTVAATHISRDVLDHHPAYATLLADAATTGCCPVWLDERALPTIDPTGDPQTVLADIAGRDPGRFLQDHWPRNRPQCGCRETVETFPGLAPAIPTPDDPLLVATTSRLAELPSHLAIVAATRPADAPALLGWRGAVRRHDDVVGLSAVLRSWEQRFGAVLVRIDSSVLWLSVAAPPRTEPQCRAVAAEHVAFCPDVDSEGPRPLRHYAAGLAGNDTWRFRWD